MVNTSIFIFIVITTLYEYNILFVEGIDRPIIGVLAQEFPHGQELSHFPATSYIHTTYVKAIEAGGARVVPILIRQDRSYYEKLLNSINGVVIPGGQTERKPGYGFYDTVTIVYDIAKKLNDKGIYFPIFGVCNGFEVLFIIDNNHNDMQIKCDVRNEYYPLTFEPNFRKSLMFSRVSEEIIIYLKYFDVTGHYHDWCTTPKNFTDVGLSEKWRVTGTSYTRRGLKFISTVEHKKYPFIAVQFHPERHFSEWIPQDTKKYSKPNVKANQYFYDLIVDLAKLNYNKFPSENATRKALIYNYSSVYESNTSYVQMYLRYMLQELNATAIFIINLSASDLMFCVFNLPLAATTFWLRRWKQGYLVCQLYPLMRYGLVAVSLFTILAITINRYIMISHPNIYPKLYRKEYLLLMVAATWLCAFGTLVPTWFGKWGRFGLDVNVGSCSILPDANGYSPKQFLFLVAFVIPCLFIAICYARIFSIVRKTARRSHTLTGHANTAAAAAITTVNAVTTAGGRQNLRIIPIGGIGGGGGDDDDGDYASTFTGNKLKRIGHHSYEDSAIGSSSVPSSSTNEKSSSSAAAAVAVEREDVISDSAAAVAARCPNLLSPPNRCAYYAKIAVEPSSSSGLDDDYGSGYFGGGGGGGDEYAASPSRSVSPSTASLNSPHKSQISAATAVAKKWGGGRERAASTINATFNQMATAFTNTLNRRSPIGFESARRRRCSAVPTHPGKMSTKDKKLLKMILVIFSSFVICYLPITITKTSKYLSEFHVLNICGYLLIYLTTCINPIIYVVMSSEYRQAYKNLLTCRRTTIDTSSARLKRARK